MRNRSISLVLGFCLAFLAGLAHAQEPAPIGVTLTLTHVLPDKWRADYVFSEPALAIELGKQVGGYRKDAWRVLTPGVSLVEESGSDFLRGDKAFTSLGVEISTYRPFAQGNYSPINRFSDGGSAIYLGFFTGTLRQENRTCPMAVKLRLNGLPGETVIAPDVAKPELDGYAYFGPAKPKAAGVANVILDPATPTWLVDVMQETTGKVTSYYDAAFQRKLDKAPLVMVAMIGFDTPGISMKGGAVAGQVVYRLEGAGFKDDNPKKRKMVAELIAHELAHVWQLNVRRGGAGEAEIWVHEGGAEAIATKALAATGIWTEEDADSYADRLLKECAQLGDSVESYRGFYACGFKRFRGYDMDIVPLWKAMMETTETTGAVYSESMIKTILAKAAQQKE
jgi:hypothetical protein